jgi:hypothetical protein
VHVVDLGGDASGPRLGGELSNCGDFGCSTQMDGLVMNSSGFTAVHATTNEAGTDPPQTEQIIASDDSGRQVLDTATSATAPSPPQLTDLQLVGNTLTWLHDGIPRSAQLS